MRAAPPPLRQTVATQVELREGGGYISLLGLFLCLVGVVIAMDGFSLLPIRNASEAPSWWGRLVLAAVGLAFAAAGGALAFGRRWTVFDVGQRRIVRQWTLIIPAFALPIWRTERSLSEFDSVVIALESDSESADTYPVRLSGTGKNLKVCAPTQFEKSWSLGAFLAQFLSLNLKDRSTDHELVLSPDRAGLSLLERLGSGENQPEPVVRPMTMRSDVDVRDRAARIEIPGHGSVVLPAAVAVVIIGITPWLARALPQFSRQTEAPEFVQIVGVAFVALVVGFLPLLWAVHAVLSARRTTVVTASRAGILIERRGGRRIQTKSIPADDIVAIDYSTVDSMIDSARRARGRPVTDGGHPGFSSPGGSALFTALKRWVSSKGIIVKSRRGLFVFGQGLPGEELRYLLSVVSRALVDVSASGD